MAKDLIRYDLLVQEALKGVVRRILSDAAREGLPGEHHFYISFNTGAPGVRLSQRMREKYPEEMTVVLQHQFWDLNVSDQAFEVGLSFGGVGERLLVPFDAITGFFDPSVQFGLKFEPKESATPQEMAEAPAVPPPAVAPTPVREKPAVSIRKAQPAAPQEAAPPPAAAAEPVARTKETGKAKEAREAREKDQKETPPAESGAQIVSLDAFRKKT